MLSTPPGWQPISFYVWDVWGGFQYFNLFVVPQFSSRDRLSYTVPGTWVRVCVCVCVMRLWDGIFSPKLNKGMISAAVHSYQSLFIPVITVILLGQCLSFAAWITSIISTIPINSILRPNHTLFLPRQPCFQCPRFVERCNHCTPCLLMWLGMKKLFIMSDNIIPRYILKRPRATPWLDVYCECLQKGK